MFFYTFYQIYFKTVAKIVYICDFATANKPVILGIKLKKLPTCLLHNVKKKNFILENVPVLFVSVKM